MGMEPPLRGVAARGVDGRGNAIFGWIGRYLFGRDCDWRFFWGSLEYSLEYFFDSFLLSHSFIEFTLLLNSFY